LWNPQQEGCREVNDFVAKHYEDWAATLLEKGELVDVTDEAKASAGLFRIDPQGGFKPGHRYTFATLHSESKAAESGMPQLPTGSVTVEIDAEPVAESLATAVTLQLDGTPANSMLSLPEGGSCSESLLAQVQKLSYQLSPALSRYQDSILYFTKYTQTGA